MARTADGAISYVLHAPPLVIPIVGIIRFNNDRLKVVTGFKVKPNHWNDERGRVKNVVDATDRNQINSFLAGLEKEQILF